MYVVLSVFLHFLFCHCIENKVRTNFHTPLLFDRDGHVEFYTHPWCAHHTYDNQEVDFVGTVSFLPAHITKKLAALAVYASTGG